MPGLWEPRFLNPFFIAQTYRRRLLTANYLPVPDAMEPGISDFRMATQDTTAPQRRLPPRSTALSFGRAVFALGVVSFLGFIVGVALWQLDDQELRARFWTFSTISFRDQDTIWLGICFIAAISGYGLLRNNSECRTLPDHARNWLGMAPPLAWSAGISLFVFLLTATGTYLLHHRYGVVADEYLAELQAAIFREGHLMAPYPAEWDEYREALHPFFVYWDNNHHLLASDYRPVFAGLRALFSLVSLDAVTNSVLTAISVFLAAAVARRLWPERRDATILAAILMASSPQILFMGMTGFAWPAHLCLNLLWLLLFLRGTRTGHASAALVGFFAAGLHQIHVHAFFVMPFMLGLLFSRRWVLASFYATVYGAGHLIWIFWHDIAVWWTASAAPLSGESGGENYVTNALSLISLNALTAPLTLQNLLRFLAWLNPVILPLALVGVSSWSKLPPIMRKLAWGCLLSMVPYILLIPNQYHAWGYRYLHSLIGNFVLMATYGWITLSNTIADRYAWLATRRVVTGFTVLTLIIALPLRAYQVESYVRPLAAAREHVQSLTSDIVVISVIDTWFTADLVRNDPYLRERPIFLLGEMLTPTQLRHICRTYEVKIIDQDDLLPFGIEPVEVRFRSMDLAFRLAELRILMSSPICNRSD